MRQHLTSRPFFFMPEVTYLAVSNAIVSVNVGSVPDGASGAFIAAAPGLGDIMWARSSSTTIPSATVGIPLLKSDYLVVRDQIDNIKNMKFIRQASTDGIVTFQWITE